LVYFDGRKITEQTSQTFRESELCDFWETKGRFVWGPWSS